jgi:hypothetical protein
MIDNEKRAVACTLVEKFFNGEITNDDLADDFPSGRNDPALNGIYRQLWFCWDDTHTHKINERYKTGEARAFFERCISFLGSDVEYQWPPRIGASLLLFLLRAVGAKTLAKRREEQELDALKKYGATLIFGHS